MKIPLKVKISIKIDYLTNFSLNYNLSADLRQISYIDTNLEIMNLLSIDSTLTKNNENVLLFIKQFFRNFSQV